MVWSQWGSDVSSRAWDVLACFAASSTPSIKNIGDFKLNFAGVELKKTTDRFLVG